MKDIELLTGKEVSRSLESRPSPARREAAIMSATNIAIALKLEVIFISCEQKKIHGENFFRKTTSARQSATRLRF